MMADNRADINQEGPVKRRARNVNFIPNTPSPLSQNTSSSDVEPIKLIRRKSKTLLHLINSTPITRTNNTSAQQQTNTDASNTQQPAVTRSLSLFGNSTQTQQPQGGTSLFGGQQNQQQQNTSSLFGGNTQNQGTQNAGTSSLFGGNTQQQNTQNTQAGGLFGSSTMNRGTGLFGSTNTMPPPQTGGTSLFGGQQNQQQQGTSSLFGGQQNQQQGTSSLFGAPQNQQQQPQQGQSLFGLTATQPGAPSLLGASTHRVSQYNQFPGRLTMGQQSTGAATGSATGTAGASTTGQAAAPINYDSLRPTTRFNDCIPQIQGDLEKMDAMIAAQERFCREIEAFIPMHGDNVRSLKPDVELITEKVENAEAALSTDAQQVESEKAVLAKDGKDGERIRRVVDNLRQPREYQYSGFSSMRNTNTTSDSADGSVVRDMDLIGNYFVPLTASLQNTVNAYSGNLAEIEQHLRVIEASAVAQAQQLAAKRAGVRTGEGQSGEETVRELAETLRGFEASILGAASQVGQCREGLNELVLGRLGR